MKNDHYISRRKFLEKSTAATAAASLSPLILARRAYGNTSPSALNQWPGRCVVNYNNSASQGTAIKEDVVKAMIDDSIKSLTGEAAVGQAWKALFPALTVNTKIVIKVNILNTIVAPHPYVVKGIVEGLQQMDIGGSTLPAANITIYDGNNSKTFAQARYNTADFPGVILAKYDKAPNNAHLTDYGDGPHNNQPYVSCLNEADYLINVPVLKGHGSETWCGRVTLGFKNHYGSFPPLYHDATGTGYLRDINCTGPVYNKTALTVVSAILGNGEGDSENGTVTTFLEYAKTKDPATANPLPNTVIMSTDPVTTEFQAIKVMRLQDSNPYTAASMPDYLKASGGIAGVLSPTYNIGIINENEMDCREIINGVKIEKPFIPRAGSSGKLLVYPNPVKRHVFIDIIAPDNFSGNRAIVEIYNVRGKLVKKIIHCLHGMQSRLVWDGRDSFNKPLSAGKFIVKVLLGPHTLTGHVSLIK